MPYRRRTFRKRRTYRRRRRPTRGAVYGAAGRQLWKDVQKLKNFVNVEFKYTDSTTLHSATTTPVLQLINGLDDGDTQSDRQGDSVRFKSLQADIELTRGNVDTVVRLMWVIDTKPNQSSIPAFTDIINPVGTNPVIGVRNLDNRTRFVILKDKCVTLSAGTSTTKQLSWYKRLDMKTFYTTDASDVTGIQQHSLYFIFCSDQVPGDGASPISAVNRLRYIDN